MAEIRCPMCGKPNPDHLDTCQFCQARLKPLIISDKPEGSSASQNQSKTGSDLPDWFDFESSDFTEGEDSSPFEENAEDWLFRLAGDEPEESGRSGGEDEPHQAAARMDFDDNGIPDWLENLDKDRSTPPMQTDSEQAFDTDFPDWLSAESGESEAEESLQPESEMPGWLSDLGQEDETTPESIFQSQESTPPFAGDDQDILRWMLDDQESSEEQPTTAPEEDADWLLKFGSQDTVPITSDDSGFEESVDRLPDWLNGEETEPESAPPEAAEGELPAWLMDMEGAETEEAAPATVDQESDLPDWLRGEEVEPESAAPEAAEGELPAWLMDMESAEAEELTPATAAEESDLPDWLRGEETEPESAAPEAAEGELPPWLMDMEGTEAEEAAPVSSPNAAEQPDWLADIGEAAVAGAVAFGAEEVSSAAEEELPAWLMGKDEELESSFAEDEEELPDWLADMEGFKPVPEEEAAFPISDADVEESRAVPDWLHDMEETDLTSEEFGLEQAAEEAQATPVSPFVTDAEFEDDLLALDELPDWGLGDSAGESSSIPEMGTPLDEDLAPAELPGWLEAMRPIESSVPDSQQRGPVENSGPLAGLYSVLSAEPDIIRLKKPPVYSNKLQVTDAQHSHATLLQGLLESESKPGALPSPALISRHRVFKAILGAILVLVAFLAVLGNTQMTAMPQTVPAGVRQSSQLVNALTPNDTVLLAFDYQPGLAGEMEATAAGMVDHIMLRGAKLVLVSTSPTGPALAERFITNIESAHNYVSGTQYVDLGYIPGGVSGLASFARDPQWFAPNTLDGVLAWQTAPLQNVNGLSDFALVVVLTDDPNTARGWIEQVGPQLGDTPMTAVVSAQVEPMIRPYADSQLAQLSGLISGLPGGAAYEVMTRNNLARNYWDAFNIVLVVAVSAILIGSIITVISDLLARRKGSGGESA